MIKNDKVIIVHMGQIGQFSWETPVFKLDIHGCGWGSNSMTKLTLKTDNLNNHRSENIFKGLLDVEYNGG